MFSIEQSVSNNKYHMVRWNIISYRKTSLLFSIPIIFLQCSDIIILVFAILYSQVIFNLKNEEVL